MNICPHCQRMLLSHASARCNWCGSEIEDAQYQEQTAVEREQFFAHQAEMDALSKARLASINLNAYDPTISVVTGAPLGLRPGVTKMPRSTPVPMAAPQIKKTEPGNETGKEDAGKEDGGDRFQRLELD